MSAAQIQKLEALLERVHTRRQEPRRAAAKPAVAPRQRKATPLQQAAGNASKFAPRPASSPPPKPTSISTALDAPGLKPAQTPKAVPTHAARAPAPKPAPVQAAPKAPVHEPQPVARGSFAPPKEPIARVVSKPAAEPTFGDLFADALSLRPDE